ncbi:hypothetical protein K040078D81_28690 [Blautia hominis]|uniref:Uncharacterized protein n=1 Tax=Blautia hominis TaxID=2025493 RepID=A0ABQ0BBE7_9FIRM
MLFGETPEDVLGIDVAWSMGDIFDNGIGDSRRSVLEQVSYIWLTAPPAFVPPPKKLDQKSHNWRSVFLWLNMDST